MISNNCQLKNSSEKGEGLYALKSFKRGDIVYICQIEKDNIQNNAHASQVDINKWVLFTILGRSINHSCNSNCGIGFNGTNWSYVAFRDIQAGDQLTYDYAMANYKVENFPKCLCGHQKCRREIKGFQNLTAQLKKEYRGFVAPYLEKMIQDQQSQQNL